MSTTLSILEYFQAQQIEELFKGPLSDIEFIYSKSDESGDEKKPTDAHSISGTQHAPCSSAPPPGITQGRGNCHSIIRRKKKRLAQQKAKVVESTDSKHITKDLKHGAMDPKHAAVTVESRLGA